MLQGRSRATSEPAAGMARLPSSNCLTSILLFAPVDCRATIALPVERQTGTAHSVEGENLFDFWQGNQYLCGWIMQVALTEEAPVEFYDSRTVAAQLGIPYRTLMYWVETGLIHPHTYSGRRR